MEIVKIDLKNIRVERQKNNINNVISSITNVINNKDKISDDIFIKDVIKKFEKICNKKALERVLDFLAMDFNKLIEELINNEISIKLLAMLISKNASRQGMKDEKYIIEICSIIANKVGIKIKNLSATAYRPLKKGGIITNKEYRKNKYNKSNCLKSLDAKITGKVKGWIFAKVVLGKGGHQDNVFEEAHNFIEWVKEYGIKEEYYIVLIDTDLESKFIELKNSNDSKNIIVCNHCELQEWFMSYSN